MEVVERIVAVRRALAEARARGEAIRFVPTMGALHAGHRSLIEAARRDGGCVVVSIFVNPTQFGPGEDLERYPRPREADLAACRDAGVDVAFLPGAEEVYPAGAATTVRVARLTETLCGPARPGHFEGVATVVAKLLNIVRPDAAYFGEKDAQQLAVIRRMVRDLDFPVEIVGCPTVREADGLALSSRNALLSDAERARAVGIIRALRAAVERIRGGERDPGVIEGLMQGVLRTAGLERIDYASVVDAETLQPVARIEGRVLLAIAAFAGRTRLIDNLQVDPRPERS